MFDAIKQSKTRSKLVPRFFLNPSYMRGLIQEFYKIKNAVRVELNLFEQAGLTQSYKDGKKTCAR